MKKLIYSLILLQGGLSGARACNTCGCAASNQYIGILPDGAGHFIGLQYQYRWYESHHDDADAGKPAGREYYQTAQLWGRAAIGRRLQLFAFVPYQYNVKLEGAARNTLGGIGDITALLSIQILQPKEAKGWQHSLKAGGGIKAPTGAYDNSVLGSGDALAPSMQAGTGSWDIVANASYTLQHGHTGLQAEGAYARTLPNHQDYKYGNRISGGAQVFYQWKRKEVSLLPSAGLRYEGAAADYDNYTVRSEAPYTGGYMLYAAAGLRAYYRHWGVNAGYYVPVAQHYGGGLVRSLGKAEAGLMYLF